MKKTILRLATISAAVVTLTSCVDTIDTVKTGVSAFQGLKGGYESYYSFKTIKSLTNTKPVFRGYQSIKVEALVFPRKNIENFPKIFQDNLAYNLEQVIDTTTLDKKICTKDSECSGKTIIARFVEKGYKDDIAHRLFMGGKLRGEIQYIDKETGKIIDTSKVENAKNYEELFKIAIREAEIKLLKELEVEGKGDQIQEVANKINQLDPIKPEYKEMFKES